MTKIYPKLYVGPMSKLCVDAVIEHNADSSEKLGLLPSRRQVETEMLGGGYVNSWTTEIFSQYVLSSEGTIIQRDHAGPSQGSSQDDGKDSLFSDIDAGIKLLHIDPWKKYKSIQAACDSTFDLMEKCLERNSDTKFEVGTEEAIRPMSSRDVEKFLKLLKNKSEDVFKAIVYGVVQSGTSVIEDRNIGDFNPDKSREMCEIVKDYGLLTKEHNCDYLTPSQIRQRMKCGVDSFNIAPEFGVTQTKILLDLLEMNDSVKERKDFIKKCVDSEKWVKWMLPGKKDDLFLAQICGHYNFTSKEAKKCYSSLHEDYSLDKIVKETFRKRFSEILCVLQE
tara:strand:- start:6 stop:1013 length:1008 start_codon:yes stop_codon:yes gene_type:complete